MWEELCDQTSAKSSATRIHWELFLIFECKIILEMWERIGEVNLTSEVSGDVDIKILSMSFWENRENGGGNVWVQVKPEQRDLKIDF
jgi:hypothetical protein